MRNKPKSFGVKSGIAGDTAKRRARMDPSSSFIIDFSEAFFDLGHAAKMHPITIPVEVGRNSQGVGSRRNNSGGRRDSGVSGAPLGTPD